MGAWDRRDPAPASDLRGGSRRRTVSPGAKRLKPPLLICAPRKPSRPTSAAGTDKVAPRTARLDQQDVTDGILRTWPSVATDHQPNQPPNKVIDVHVASLASPRATCSKRNPGCQTAAGRPGNRIQGNSRPPAGRLAKPARAPHCTSFRQMLMPGQSPDTIRQQICPCQRPGAHSPRQSRVPHCLYSARTGTTIYPAVWISGPGRSRHILRPLCPCQTCPAPAPIRSPLRNPCSPARSVTGRGKSHIHPRPPSAILRRAIDVDPPDR